MNKKPKPKHTNNPFPPAQTGHPKGGKQPQGGTKKGGGPPNPHDGSQHPGPGK